MTKQQKLKDLRHILKLIEEGGDHDEIDTWTFQTIDPDQAHFALDMGCGCPEYMTSLDAIKAIERDGWDWFAARTGVRNNSSYQCKHIICTSIDLPTEQAARLYAVIITYIWDIENDRI